MLAAGMVLIWTGYAVGSWGYVLVRGWNIPLRAWMSPLHPYQWPAGGELPGSIPASQLFPSGAGGSAPSASGGGAGGSPPGAATQPAPGASGAPGTVPIRTQ